MSFSQFQGSLLSDLSWTRSHVASRPGSWFTLHILVFHANLAIQIHHRVEARTVSCWRSLYDLLTHILVSQPAHLDVSRARSEIASVIRTVAYFCRVQQACMCVFSFSSCPIRSIISIALAEYRRVAVNLQTLLTPIQTHRALDFTTF